MSNDFEKHWIPDLGQKLAHLEGVLGAYLPKHTFDGGFQQGAVDADKYSFSRLRNGRRQVSNWELGCFIEIFDLARYELDYRVFLKPLNEFEKVLRQSGVGSYGSTAAEQMRELLRASVNVVEQIKISRDRRLNVGGIGAEEEEPDMPCLTPRDRVALTVPLKMSEPSDHLLLLHDFPSARSMSTLLPSLYAPEPVPVGQSIRLPQTASGYVTFPVGGKPGYRCLYAIRTDLDLTRLLELQDPENTVPEVNPQKMALFMNALKNAVLNKNRPVQIAFGEYVLT